jgi:hypothetical protein
MRATGRAGVNDFPVNLDRHIDRRLAARGIGQYA